MLQRMAALVGYCGPKKSPSFLMPDYDTISINPNIKPTVTMISASLRRGISDEEVLMAAYEATSASELLIDDAEENNKTNEVVY